MASTTDGLPREHAHADRLRRYFPYPLWQVITVGAGEYGLVSSLRACVLASRTDLLSSFTTTSGTTIHEVEALFDVCRQRLVALLKLKSSPFTKSDHYFAATGDNTRSTQGRGREADGVTIGVAVGVCEVLTCGTRVHHTD
jgi:hypothetical protein